MMLKQRTSLPRALTDANAVDAGPRAGSCRRPIQLYRVSDCLLFPKLEVDVLDVPYSGHLKSAEALVLHISPTQLIEQTQGQLLADFKEIVKQLRKEYGAGRVPSGLEFECWRLHHDEGCTHDRVAVLLAPHLGARTTDAGKQQRVIRACEAVDAFLGTNAGQQLLTDKASSFSQHRKTGFLN